MLETAPDLDAASRVAAAAVGAYIGSAYWFTSSTSFANPAVTIGRMFSDTFAGIAPGSVPACGDAGVLGASVQALTARRHPGPLPPQRLAERLPETIADLQRQRSAFEADLERTGW